LSDLFAWWRQDLTIMPSGDLMVCRGIEPTGSVMPSSATVEGEQRVLRRLLTNPGSYIWHLEYGAGLPQYVGQSFQTRPLTPAETPDSQPSQIAAIIMAQMLLEDTVSRDPLPKVKVTPRANGNIHADISYADNRVGRIVTLGFDVNA
jgi:hypothetical protein